jgi:Arc/MetJ-type ribon-helix-helix transcriptional regulator
MDVRLNPALQARVDEWVEQTGRPADGLVMDLLAGYFDEIARLRTTVDDRHDDLKSEKVQSIDGEAFFESLRRPEE